MALFTLNFESQYLCNNTEVSVIMPDRPRNIDAADFYSSGKKYPVMWLLHGTFGDHTDWVRHTNIELYACERDVIVVMPSALNSDYNNWPNFGMGFDMEKALIDELMPMIHNWFPASGKREDNFVCGLSMGGMGAGHYAAWYPEKFGGCAMLSGCPSDPRVSLESAKTAKADTPLAKAIRADVRGNNQINSVGGPEKYLGSHRNDWDRFGKLAKTGELPKLYAADGTKDFLYEGNYLVFKKYAEEIGLDVTFEEIEGYNHEWRFWDITVQKAMDFFGLGVDTDAGNQF